MAIVPKKLSRPYVATPENVGVWHVEVFVGHLMGGDNRASVMAHRSRGATFT